MSKVCKKQGNKEYLGNKDYYAINIYQNVFLTGCSLGKLNFMYLNSVKDISGKIFSLLW